MTTINSIGSVDPNALRDVLSRPGESTPEKIKQAGVQFEAIMLRQFLGDALKPSIQGEVEESSGSDTYRYFITDTLSQSLAQRGVFGIGEQISKQLLAREERIKAPEDGTTNALNTEAVTENKTQKPKKS